MSTVILAEKPDQARSYMKGLGIDFKGRSATGTGNTFLDPKTTVVSAAGHLVDLSEPEKYDAQYKDRNNMDILPLIPHRFRYTLDHNKKFYFDIIKRNLEQVDQIIVATDKDDEGCAIAYNILRLCRKLYFHNIKRAYPSAMNKTAVIRQFKHLEPIQSSWNHAKAAIARSRSDWLLGINLSRLYTYNLRELGINGNFAIGRAISTTLNLICQWNREIIDFKEQPIYELKGKIKGQFHEVPLLSDLRIVGNGHNQPKHEYIEQLKKHDILQPRKQAIIEKVKSEKKQQYPPILMTKGDLYAEMNRVAGWTQQKSKKIMQENYQQGYQTYPRTDSGKITRYMYDYLFEKFDNYLKQIDEKRRFKKYRFDNKHLKKYLTTESSAGAHLAIIPTEKMMDKNSNVTADQRLMWETVVRKSLTIVLQPCVYVSNEMTLKVNDLGFEAHNIATLDNGWKDILLPDKKGKSVSSDQTGIDFSQYFQPKQVVPVVLNNDISHTHPLHPLKTIQIYDRGGLMEKAYKYVDDPKYAKILKQTKGIGTSATRDQAMASLIQKKYVMVDHHDVITVTPEGWLINWLLRGSQVNDPILTAKWEEGYQLIGDGVTDMNALINATAKLVYMEFQHVNQDWNSTETKQFFEKHKLVSEEELSVGDCPVCGKSVIFVKDSKHNGKFDRYQCTNKDCDFYIFYHLAGKTISKTNMSRLLLGKSTTTIKHFTNRSGNPFDAKLILKRDLKTNQYHVKFAFNHQTHHFQSELLGHE